MSKSITTKASAILVGLSLLAFTIYPAFAQDATKSGLTLEESKKILPLKPVKINGRQQDKIEAKRENIEDKIADMKEKLASKTAALRLRLQDFRDKKKAEIAERVNNNLNKINQNQTAKMQKHLDKMSSILDRLEARVESNKPDISDPAAARTAILAARETIATTSAAVSAQALNDYTVVVTSEGRIGLDVKTQRDKLHSDLLTLRKMVIDAKQAVANAIRVARSGRVPVDKELKNKEGTSSGQ